MKTTAAAEKCGSSPDVGTRIHTQYGCGPVHFAGTDEALYERHLLFDSGVEITEATPYHLKGVLIASL